VEALNLWRLLGKCPFPPPKSGPEFSPYSHLAPSFTCLTDSSATVIDVRLTVMIVCANPSQKTSDATHDVWAGDVNDFPFQENRMI